MKHNLTVISAVVKKHLFLFLIWAKVENIRGQTHVTVSGMGLGQDSSALPQNRMTLNPN